MHRTDGDFNGDCLEVVVERILPGGLGLAHADGRTIFVALSAPGDRLRVKIERVKANVAFASIREIVEPSNTRIEPPCPYFGRCGGCDFQQMDYQAQLAAKVDIIKDCLRRIGRIEEIPEFQIVAAPNQWHYRSRAQWQYDSAQRRLGYFESGSRRVCDVADCAVLVPALQNELGRLRERMTAGAVADDVRHLRAIAGDHAVSIVDDKGRNPTAREGAAVTVSRTIAGETYELDAENFFQANADLLPQLIDAALDDNTGETAIELYCGVGLFTLPLARRFETVIGVEGDNFASQFAQRNVRNANVSNVRIENEDVGNWLAWNQRHPEARPLDFLLLDPPRTGAESRVVAGINRLRPKKISYVSCDPATLARDLKKMIAGGYAIETIKAFDMFPQTHHVETVVQLTSRYLETSHNSPPKGETHEKTH
ncbi:MAG TPA: class I SAM-dependent RNA methyltransferase [Pyrinomonadaceae bacterium]|nr:class I SAM-dependent RNA methyltransferase [Pyrinomonadaceae bacterium]